ncbi:unnamed protein product [Clonostachys rosea]|uniref:Uncharacterized protein n=1 Tax=Bionectria ochroleuca TaxID=29856 RepID=A0ABY6TNN7_BIOOC|nr:unnamed protein product [Clonostachys rosea]
MHNARSLITGGRPVNLDKSRGFYYRDTVGGPFAALYGHDLIRFASLSVGEPSRPGRSGLQSNLLDRSSIVGFSILFRAGVRFWVKGLPLVSRR